MYFFLIFSRDISRDQFILIYLHSADDADHFRKKISYPALILRDLVSRDLKIKNASVILHTNVNN